MKKLIQSSFLYFMAAMAAGVFYREFTKFSGFDGKTVLADVHVHLLSLGMLLFLLTAALYQNLKLEESKSFKKFFILYNVGLPLLTVTMLIRGIVQVTGETLSRGMNGMLSGFAGISHILLMIALFFFFASLRKAAQKATKR